ncbi:hypothetical protein MHBO_001802 [Bonamia ostreae]|uniref:Ribosomal protein L16 n=1 Tax=Bonamia ostreae TaxID=126728 RepID=A0ABV2AK95_9EUKA
MLRFNKPKKMILNDFVLKINKRFAASNLVPKKPKYMKAPKKKVKGTNFNVNANSVIFGTHGLQAIESGRIKNRGLEFMRDILSKRIDKRSKFWLRVFPHWPVTKKDIGVFSNKFSKNSQKNFMKKI